jgi:hypothetical protein
MPPTFCNIFHIFPVGILRKVIKGKTGTFVHSKLPRGHIKLLVHKSSFSSLPSFGIVVARR